MLHALGKLIDEYSAFQRSRPDLPQGNLSGLSQDELEQLVTAFQLHKSQQADEAQQERPFRLHCPIIKGNERKSETAQAAQGSAASCDEPDAAALRFDSQNDA